MCLSVYVSSVFLFFFSDCPCVTKIIYNLNKFISLDIKCASESCFLMIFADMNVS